MSGRSRWGERATATGSPPAVGGGTPVLRALGWSIAVVLAAGVLAVVTAPAPPSSTVLRQGTASAVPAAQAEQEALPLPEALAAEPASPRQVPGAAGPPSPASTSATPPASATPTSGARARVAATPKAATTTAAPKPAPAVAALKLQPSLGSYPLRIAGTSSVGGVSATVPSSGSLVVEAQGGDQRHRTVGVPGDLVLVQRSSAAGIDLVSFSLTAGSTTLSFTPPAPLPFVRTQPGTWSWSVQSTDRTVTLNQTATVSSASPVMIGGTQVPAVTVQRVFNVSGASVSGTVRLTSTVSLVDRLPLIQNQSISVTAKALGGLVSKLVASESSATLTSTSPR